MKILKMGFILVFVQRILFLLKNGILLTRNLTIAGGLGLSDFLQFPCPL